MFPLKFLNKFRTLLPLSQPGAKADVSYTDYWYYFEQNWYICFICNKRFPPVLYYFQYGWKPKIEEVYVHTQTTKLTYQICENLTMF